MQFKALVTMDLPGTTDEKRAVFYAELEKALWRKIPKLTTAWQASFSEGATREGAIKTLINDIDKAKIISRISVVNYAIQVGQGDLSILLQ